MGVRRGDRVALLLRNDFAFFEATQAAAALGASPVAINWHLTEPEVAFVLQDSRAKVLVAHADLQRRIEDGIPEGVRVLTAPAPTEIARAYGLDPVCAAPRTEDTIWDDWLAAHPPLANICRDVVDTMTYTSGTTGKPKGVIRFAQTPESAARFLATRDRLYGIRPGIRAMICGPLYHAAPNAFGMRAITAAERIVLMPRFDAEIFLANVEHHRITTMFLVPTMLVRLFKLPPDVRARYDISSLEHILLAAAPCPPEVKTTALDWFGPIVHEFYGGTEVAYVSYCAPEDAIAKPGTVGRLMEGVTARILDRDGREMPLGEAGEIYSRLANAPDFTYANRASGRSAMEVDGLLATGDVGYFDADGYLFLCDRAKDMVISGGVNIYPAEIEAELLNLPGIEDAAVFGVPDAEMGERLMAVVQPVHGARPTPGEIIAALRPRLAGYKIPRRILLRDDLPRDDAGKIYKRCLREMFSATR